MFCLPQKLRVFGLVCAAVLGLNLRAQTAALGVETRISSQASVNYLDPVEFVPRAMNSNIVRVIVTGVPLIQLETESTLTRVAGGYYEFPHQLTNTGNVSGTYTVSPSLPAAPPFALLNPKLVLDLNGNGVSDLGEPSLPFAAYTVKLNAGQSANFIISGQVSPTQPSELPASSTGIFTLGVVLAETKATATKANTLKVIAPNSPEAGDLQFFKAISSPQALRGESVVYTLTGTNNDFSALEPINATIDSVILPRIIVRDVIPANMQLLELLATNNATPLYHRSGEALHTYHTRPPAKLQEVDAVAYAFSSLPSGGSFSVSYRALVGPAATGTIPNTAQVYSLRGGGSHVTDSNTVKLTVPSIPPTIQYYNNGLFEFVVPATRLGSPMFVQVNAGDCNTGAEKIDTVTIIITSALTADQESFTGVETDYNTGIFRILPNVPTENAALRPVKRGDSIIQTLPKDELTAEITGCGGVTVRTRILIDPAGIVYDSRTNKPIIGAIVTLIDVTGSGNGGNAGGPAKVLDEDAVNSVSATQTTTANGEFRYPLVAPGTYRLAVTPPAEYRFPSLIPTGGQPSGRRFEIPASLGGNFPINTSTGAVFIDIPLDTTSGKGLTLEKEASRKTAEIGDSVVYTLTLKNTSGAPFNGTTIIDRLPTGFRYEAGTARRDKVSIADPLGAAQGVLKLPVGSLANGASTVFTYRLRITPGAEKGDGLNSAQATTLGPPVLHSNIAHAKVIIEPGLLDSRGVIIGTVFVDTNGNGLQDPGEPGVPGIRLVLEDGTYAITDGQGQYSIYGQAALTHVLKLDASTLPPEAKLGGDSPRFAQDPNSRFADLKKHELHKANFLLVEPTENLLAAVAKRRQQADAGIAELTAALSTQFTADGIRPAFTDIEARDAAGVIGAGPTAPTGFTNLLPARTLSSGNSSLPARARAAVPLTPLEKSLASILDNAPGFLGLKDGDTLPSTQLTVRIKGQREAKLSLLVNGQPAPERQIGKAVEHAANELQAVEYVAIHLNPGPNTLEILQGDLFGNVRARQLIHVIAPDQLARFKVEFSNPNPSADGRTPVIATVTATDRHGVPVSASLPITLETNLGRWDVADINAREPGTQVTLENGRGTYRLIPPVEPGEAHILVSSGLLQSEQKLSFLPELRPMIAAGVLEGRIGLQNRSGSGILPLSPGDAFEDELRSNAGIGGDGTASARGALYLKGKIKGDTLLTIAYDSNKRKDDVKLFRDLDPDAYYPVYGDSSTRGYDAQSTGALYVRIDRNRSFALLGDFNTRAGNEVRQLGDYNRSLNGVRLQHENSKFKGGLWASDDSTKQVVREIAANGTSGPFNFQAGDGVLNSETVEILTRDRNQYSVILRTEKLSRNSDYEFEPFSGRILLRRPVPSVDENFNPHTIRITYEVSTNGTPFWVYGGDAQAKLGKHFELGGSFVRDENTSDPYDLQSLNSTIHIGKGTYLITEAARSQNLKEGIGYAGRVDLRHKSEKTEARVFYGETEAAFINPSAQLNAGRVEGGAKITRDIGVRTQLITEAVYTADQTGMGQREGVRVDVAHTLKNQLKLTFGGRVSEEDSSTYVGSQHSQTDKTDPISVRSLRVRADMIVPHLPQATVFGEYEQDIVTPDQRLLAAGGNYQISTKTRLYLRQEFISSLGGNFELNSTEQNNRTLVGLETEYLKDAHLFNEYRVKDSIDGPLSEAATGLRNDWSVAEGLRLHTTFERVTPFTGVTTNKSTAATLGADYTRPADWKTAGRVEGRWSPTADNYLGTLGYARKLTESWTFLARSILNAQLAGAPLSMPSSFAAPSSSTPDLLQGRILAGVAWRQSPADRWNALLRYEYKYEQGSAELGATDMHRQVHMFALSTNYQPGNRWILAGHYATKFVHETYDIGPDGAYTAHLFAGRAIFEISRRWDAGLNAAVTFSNRLGNAQYAFGPEVGFSFVKNVRVGLGYNLVGFRDRDFSASATAHGLFLSLRIKFDESLLKWARFGGQGGTP